MVGIYCRISGDKMDGIDTSIEYQEERGIEFSGKLEMKYEVYKDINVSGKAEIFSRDEFHRFIGDIKAKKITHVFAIHQDRIERNPDTWRYFVSTILNVGAKWYPEGKFYDLDSTTNRAMANLLSVFNEMHSDKTSDAVKVAFYRNALKGKTHGVNAYGITKDDNGLMVHESEEIKIVKNIFEWSLNGIGAYSIAKKLNELNVPTRFAKLNKHRTTIEVSTGIKIKHKNKLWWGSTIHGILKKKLYAGIHIWNKEEISLPHLAIISLNEYNAIQKNLKKNKRTKSGKKPIYKYLLNGLVFCKECGFMYKGKRRLSDRRNQYICSGKQAPLHVCKGGKGFNIPRFETFIIKHLFLSKNLQKRLNNIEVDTVEIDTLTFKNNELIRKLKSAEKLETKAFNYLFEDEDDLSNDARLKAKYKEAKDKVFKYKESLEQVKTELSIQNDNNRLTRVNSAIEGFKIDSGFEAIKATVQQLIESIEVMYIPHEKNGEFWFVIKYKGFNETSVWKTNQQLIQYNLIGYQKTSNTLTNTIPGFTIPKEFKDFMDSDPYRKQHFEELIDRLKKSDEQNQNKDYVQMEFGYLDTIKITKNELIIFD